MIGQSLKKAREARGWTQIDAARELGIKSGTYGGYEASGILPGPDVLDRIVEKMPELRERIEQVRSQHCKRSTFARSPTGAQTSAKAANIHTIAKAAARLRRAKYGQ